MFHREFLFMSYDWFDDILVYILLKQSIDESMTSAVEDFDSLFPYSNSREIFLTNGIFE